MVEAVASALGKMAYSQSVSSAEKRARALPPASPMARPKGSAMEATRDFDKKTSASIRDKAAWLKTLDFFPDMDQEDIEQELAVRLCAKLGNYDPARHDYHTFVRVALGWIKRDLLKARNTENEIARRSRTVSLADTLENDDNGDPLTAADIIPDGSPPLDEEAAFNADFEALLLTFSDEMRQAVRRLPARTINEVAAEMNLPVTTFRRRIYDPLREALAAFRRKRASA